MISSVSSADRKILRLPGVAPTLRGLGGLGLGPGVYDSVPAGAAEVSTGVVSEFVRAWNAWLPVRDRNVVAEIDQAIALWEDFGVQFPAEQDVVMQAIDDLWRFRIEAVAAQPSITTYGSLWAEMVSMVQSIGSLVAWITMPSGMQGFRGLGAFVPVLAVLLPVATAAVWALAAVAIAWVSGVEVKEYYLAKLQYIAEGRIAPEPPRPSVLEEISNVGLVAVLGFVAYVTLKK